MQLDLLASFNWDRPVYFAITTGNDAYIGLEDYFQLEGMAYRLIPIKTVNADRQLGRINTGILYNNMMNKFRWRSMNNPKIYLSEDNLRMTMNFRNNFGRLAGALLAEGKKDSAIKVCDKCLEVMPDNCVPFNYFILPVAEVYQKAGQPEKAEKIIKRMMEISNEELKYYFEFKKDMADQVRQDINYTVQVLQNCVMLSIPLADDYYQLGKNVDANRIVNSILDAYQQYLRLFYRKEDTDYLYQQLYPMVESHGQKDLASQIKNMMGAGQDFFEPSQTNP